MNKILNIKIQYELQSSKGGIYFRIAKGSSMIEALIYLLRKKGNRISPEIKTLITEEFKNVSRWFSKGSPGLLKSEEKNS